MGEVRHLISKLLEFKVRNRYTANEALQHPWIVRKGVSKQEEEEKGIDRVQARTLIESLATFSNTRQFKVIVVQLFRNQFEKMRPKHFNQLEQLFTAMDADGDGIVSYDEFEDAVCNVKDINIEKKYIQQIFQNVKGQKGIRFQDLLNALVHDYLVSCDERLYAAFRELDDDDDGKITTEQLKQKLAEYDPLGEWDRAIEIINQQTLDANGVIDYEEFLLNLHPNFEEAPHWLPDVMKKMKSLAPDPEAKKKKKKKLFPPPQKKKKKKKKKK